MEKLLKRLSQGQEIVAACFSLSSIPPVYKCDSRCYVTISRKALDVLGCQRREVFLQQAMDEDVAPADFAE